MNRFQKFSLFLFVKIRTLRTSTTKGHTKNEQEDPNNPIWVDDLLEMDDKTLVCPFV
jgi:hypothetical protein